MSKKEDDIISFLVEEDSQGKRLDKFLSEKFTDKSRNWIQKIILQQKVKLNGNVISKNYQIRNGDIIKIENPEYVNAELNGIKPQNIDLEILYQDKYLCVISKKFGMLTHPVPGFRENTVVNALLYHFKNLSIFSGTERAGIVHRLDKNTSGILIIALDDNTHRTLSDNFKQRKIQKTYSALVSGRFTEKEGKILLPIGRSRLDRKKMGISSDRGRESETGFKVIEEFQKATLLDVYPKTGRTHQIRVHFSFIGHPIIGDEVYGNKESALLTKEIGIKRQFLHAKKIVFTHPVTGQIIEIADKLTEDLEEALEKLRRKR